jgi:probable rRNA maturation factor
VTIALVSDRRMRALNRAFRGRNAVTDVLSFPASPPSGGRRRQAGSSGYLGDIVIAMGVAARQAAQAGHSLATELRVLALHGLLHLLGYDHEHDDGAMARVEERLRRRAGLKEGLIARHAR